MTSANGNMELIQSTFREAKEMALVTSDLNMLNNKLLNFPAEFISVGYEGASNGIALKSIEDTNSLTNWNTFYHDYAAAHSAQVHVGLGWAFSELEKDFSSFDIAIDPLMKYRVLDGYGYYEGIFKRRQSIRTQQTPEHFDALSVRAYNQGLGRSFWYIAQGEVEKLTRLASLFPDNRLHDLWRGIGIAVAYVGGNGKLSLQEIVNQAGYYQSSFKCGASLLIQSRYKAKTIAQDTTMICELLFDTDCENISNRLAKIEEQSEVATDAKYFDWIKNIETQICT